jgi:hypothetical protein
MDNYKEESIDKYAELIPHYTWVKETSTEEKYHFSDNTPGTFLEVDGKKLNLFIKDDFYQENSMTSYNVDVNDGIVYLSIGLEKYIIKSISVDENSYTAIMVLLIISNNVPIKYLGFKGNFNDSIFKS